MIWTVKVNYRNGEQKEYQERGLSNEIVQCKVFKKYELDWNIVESVITIPHNEIK